MPAPKTLTKDCRCVACGEIIKAGEPFAYHKGRRAVASYALGAGSGSLVEVDTYRPSHAFDCFGAKVKADARARDLQMIEDACKYAESKGMDAEYLAKLRADLMEARRVK